MAKRKKVTRAGQLVKAVIYTAPQPRDSEHARAVKSRMTSAARRAMNAQTAQGRLEMLLAANFGQRDFFCTLTYRDECLPPNLREAKIRVRAFLKALRLQRRREGAELRYIYVTEGRHGDKRYHHHLVVSASGPGDVELIYSLWAHGEVLDVERIADHEAVEIAKYITKEAAEGRPNGAQMWTRSRNLAPPDIESYFVSDDEALQAPPGAQVLEREEKQNEYGGYSYLKYRLPPERTPFHPRPREKKKKHTKNIAPRK